MAKSKTTSDEVISLEFLRVGNPWIDAGIVGLWRILRGKPPYLKVASTQGRVDTFPQVKFDELREDRLVITGPTNQVQLCLEWAYDRLVADYFNVSSKKQLADKSSWNFYWDTNRNSFVTFPKKKAVGVASLLFDKAARPSGEQVAWKVGPADERIVGVLPESHKELQSSLDEFLATNGLKAGPPAGLLVDGENEVRPKVEIRVQSGKVRGSCFLTGTAESTLVEAKETAFPLLGGSRSFINGAADWPRMGWKIDLVGKFVPAVAFFYHQGDDLHVFFPESSDLRRIDELADRLASMVQVEPNLFRNFDLLLGSYLQRRSEVALAFLHRVFVELSKVQIVDRQAQIEEAIRQSSVLEPDDDDDDNEEVETATSPKVVEEPPPVISSGAVFNQLRRHGDVSFTVVSASKKGNVWMAGDFTTFRDIDRLARLFEAMQQTVDRGKRRRIACHPRKFFLALVDFEAKTESRTVLRDKVCEAIFRRQSVLALLERHAFHVNRHSDQSKVRRVGPLLDFARLYEVDLHKGTLMENAYQSMVETATWLGSIIGEALAEAVKGKADSDGKEGASPESRVAKESAGKAKGGLHRLHKTRTVADFINELARLQLRYRINVPKDVLDGKTFTPELFEEFRGFCVVAALNRFQYLSPSQASSNSSTTRQ